MAGNRCTPDTRRRQRRACNRKLKTEKRRSNVVAKCLRKLKTDITYIYNLITKSKSQGYKCRSNDRKLKRKEARLTAKLAVDLANYGRNDWLCKATNRRSALTKTTNVKTRRRRAPTKSPQTTETAEAETVTTCDQELSPVSENNCDTPQES